MAEKLSELLPVVPYRHLVFTLPKKMGIRARFRQDRSLFRSTARLVTRLLTRWMRCRLSIQQDTAHAHPGILLAQQSFGDQIKVHPHYHVLTTTGLFLPDGSFYSVSDFDEADLTARLRQSVLSSLVRRNQLLPENAAKMLSWPLERSGFNVHVGPVVQGEDRERLRGLVRYVMRAPLSLKRLDYDEASGQVRYRGSHGDVKTWPHAIHFLADLAQHIPKARQQTVSYHGWFANPTGHLSRRQEKVEKAPNRRGRWAARVLRVWQVDPELCPRCGKRMSRSRAVLERLELVRLLKALGRFGYPPRPPPRPPEPLGWSLTSLMTAPLPMSAPRFQSTGTTRASFLSTGRLAPTLHSLRTPGLSVAGPNLSVRFLQQGLSREASGPPSGQQPHSNRSAQESSDP